ncbi:MAG TPA: Pycsar system effector family protein [Caulobacteraceae bacterium]
MASVAAKIAEVERALMHERFADFERSVLQDNIVLCDAKSGVLLAFSGAMVIFCLDAFIASRGTAIRGSSPHLGAIVLFVVAALGFLVSCHFSLSTVLPRLRRGQGRSDHIFWEAPFFRLPVDKYVEEMMALDLSVEHEDRLRHLHTLAGICRSKFRNFQLAMRFGQASFVVLVLAELARILA